MKILVWHSQWAMSALGQRALAVSPFSFFSFSSLSFSFSKKQKIENQTELNPVTSWTLNSSKAAYALPH
jgi:hypothetical protein